MSAILVGPGLSPYIRVRDGVYHIQNADAFHSRFKAFMAPFCGPATRHLPLYVGWMVLRDQLRAGQPLQNLHTLASGRPLLERFLRHGRQADLTRGKLPDLVSPIPVQLSLPLTTP